MATAAAEAPITTDNSNVVVEKTGLAALRHDLIEKPAAEKKAAAAISQGKKEAPSPEEAAVVKEPVALKLEKTTEVKTEPSIAQEVDTFLKSATPKSKDRFLDLSNKQAEALYQERLKSIKLLTPEVEQKLTSAEKRATELESELRQVAIERSPEYKQKFVERPKEIKAALVDFAKTWEIADTELLSAVEGGKDSRRQLNTLLETIGTMDRADVTELAREYQKIQDDKTKVFSDHEMALKLLQERRHEETRGAVEKLVAARSEALKTSVLPQFEKEYAPIFEGEEGASLKSTVLSHIQNLNGCDLESMKPDDRGAMIACAFMAQPLIKRVNAQAERIAELEAQLVKEDDGTPKVGGRSTSAPIEEKPKGAFERMREEMGMTK